MVDIKEKVEEFVAAGKKLNRTGIQTSPFDSKAMIEAAEQSLPSSAGTTIRLPRFRAEAAESAEAIGSMPPPGSLKGAGKAAVDVIKGKSPTALIDHMAARLAFERTGTRLYEAVLAKHDALGSWPGGPSREDIYRLYSEEFEHFVFLRDAMEARGADPTAMTPSADLTAVESSGVLKSIVDPRVNLAQTMHALLIAELADEAGWESLIRVARQVGEDELADRSEAALIEEQRHLVNVKEWWMEHVLARTEGEEETAAEGGERHAQP